MNDKAMKFEDIRDHKIKLSKFNEKNVGITSIEITIEDLYKVFKEQYKKDVTRWATS